VLAGRAASPCQAQEPAAHSRAAGAFGTRPATALIASPAWDDAPLWTRCWRMRLTRWWAATRIRVGDGAIWVNNRHLLGDRVWLAGEWRSQGERKYQPGNRSPGAPLCALVLDEATSVDSYKRPVHGRPCAQPTSHNNNPLFDYRATRNTRSPRHATQRRTDVWQMEVPIPSFEQGLASIADDCLPLLCKRPSPPAAAGSAEAHHSPAPQSQNCS
jgi:hypothetical protein